MSAIAPAGSASSITGRLSAASTSATSDGDDESDVISQPAPTSCIHVPTLETMVAIHRLRNNALRSGLHAEGGARAGAASAPPVVCAGLTTRRSTGSFELHRDLVDVAPAPILAGLERGHDRMTGRMEVFVACRFFESSQHPTCPHVRQRRRCTQLSPIARHSSQPRVVGVAVTTDFK